jgi:hypothetical protein
VDVLGISLGQRQEAAPRTAIHHHHCHTHSYEGGREGGREEKGEEEGKGRWMRREGV